MLHKITAEPSQLSFSADDDETILDAALDAGLVMQYGCKSGACGACKCKIISGEIELGNYKPHALSDEERANGYTLACKTTAKTDLVIETTLTANEKIFSADQTTAQVHKMQQLNDDTIIIHLSLSAPIDYKPGQYIKFILQDGSRRSYSMASLPTDTIAASKQQDIELHIRCMPNGQFTNHVFNHMKENDTWQIEGPYGTFYFRDNSSKPIIFVASGTGFAPVKAILREIQSKNIQTKIVLYWGGRRPKDLYQTQWVEAHLKNMPQLSFIPVISDALPEDQWQGRTGMVHHAVMHDYPDMSAYQVYACGTPNMVSAAHKDFIAKCNLSESAFYMDSFISSAEE